MKKAMGFAAAIMLFLSALAFAGGDKVCGDKASGPAGDTGGGTTTQNRAAD